jgi:hypothetical protein
MNSFQLMQIKTKLSYFKQSKNKNKQEVLQVLIIYYLGKKQADYGAL